MQPRLGAAQHITVNDMPSGLGEWRGQYQVVCAGEQVVDIPRGFYTFQLNGRRALAQCDHVDPKGQGLVREGFADGTKAEQAQGGALERAQCGEMPLGVLHPDVRQMLGRGKERRQGEFGEVIGGAAPGGADRWAVEQPLRVKIDAR